MSVQKKPKKTYIHRRKIGVFCHVYKIFVSICQFVVTWKRNCLLILRNIVLIDRLRANHSLPLSFWWNVSIISLRITSWKAWRYIDSNWWITLPYDISCHINMKFLFKDNCSLHMVLVLVDVSFLFNNMTFTYICFVSMVYFVSMVTIFFPSLIGWLVEKKKRQWKSKPSNDVSTTLISNNTVS